MENLRHFTRAIVSLGAEIMYMDKAFPVEVKDVSLGGAFIKSNLSLRIDEQLELRIFLNSVEHVVETFARVAWLSPSNDGFGLEFGHLKPIDVWALLRQTKIDPKEAFQMPDEKK